MHKFALVILSLFMVGCASMGSVVIDDLNMPLKELQREAAQALPLGKRRQSLNERTLYSEYFIFSKGEYLPAGEMPVRNYAEITILGDRRPYSIEVRVVQERRGQAGTYTREKYEKGMALVISRRIQSALHKRRDDRNIIDDFRVF